MTDPKHDPTTFSLITYGWVIVLAMWGGLASFIAKNKAGKARPFNVAELIGELVVSGLVGVLTFYLCTWANIDPLLAAALVGISGHMGSRAMAYFERYAERWADSRGGGQ